MVDYKVPLAPGMVVLDAVHAVQALHSPDLAVRWNSQGRQVWVVRRRSERQAAADVHGPDG